MTVPRITLFRDFAEDQRISMDIYADELAAAMRLSGRAVEIREFAPKVRRFPLASGAVGLQELRWSRYVSYPRAAVHEQGDVNHVIDHGYGHLLWTLDPDRTVVTVHDLIPLARWAGKIPGAARGRYPFLNRLSVNALRHAKRLIAVSHSTSKDLVDLCGCNPDRIRVVPNGLSPRFAPKPMDERRAVRAELGLPDGRTHLIMLSGHAFYKNQEICLAALKLLLPVLSQTAKLVRLGQVDGRWKAALERSGMGTHVIEIPSLSQSGVVDLYNSVDCLLFPSVYEGFGWPVLEAMACGTPVICSDAASLPEVAGDAAIIVNPLDVEAIAAAVRQALESPEKRAGMIERGFRHAARYRWDSHAKAVLDIYDEITSA